MASNIGGNWDNAVQVIQTASEQISKLKPRAQQRPNEKELQAMRHILENSLFSKEMGRAVTDVIKASTHGSNLPASLRTGVDKIINTLEKYRGHYDNRTNAMLEATLDRFQGISISLENISKNPLSGQHAKENMPPSHSNSVTSSNTATESVVKSEGYIKQLASLVERAEDLEDVGNDELANLGTVLQTTEEAIDNGSALEGTEELLKRLVEALETRSELPLERALRNFLRDGNEKAQQLLKQLQA